MTHIPFSLPRPVLNCLLTFGVLLNGTTFVSGADEPNKTPKPDQAALEKAFAEKLSNAVLNGSFSTDGKDGKSGDKYHIVGAKKLQGDLWQITYKAKIGQQEVDLPIAIKVLWAGDTPVMTLDEFTIPGVGTFTARVLFHGDRYVGTWQHGDHGGAMWGRVEKKTDAKPEPEKK